MASRRTQLLVAASRDLARAMQRRNFRDPVRFVYNPLVYARAPYEEYLASFAGSRKRIVFLGMNPGPWGMAQTGVPFGEVEAVRDWMGIVGEVGRPAREHPRLKVTGFACHRSEVSGRRLWGLMRGRFGTSRRFFREHFVANYCPLLFLDERGRNVTPDQIARPDRGPLYRLCDAHLAAVIELLEPDWAIGVGRFAETRLLSASEGRKWSGVRIARIPHPSPANPQANRNWASQATKILIDLGVW